MRPLLARELITMARRPALWAVPAVQVLLLSGFLLAWSGAGLVPFLPGANVYEQLRWLQWAFLSIATPWAVCRIAEGERRDEWSWLSMLTGIGPGRLLLARLSAASGYLLIVVLSALPPVVLAQQMSALPPIRTAVDVAGLFLFMVLASALTLHVVTWARGRLASWIASAVVVTAAGAIVASTSPAVLLPGLTFSSAVTALALAYRADHTLRLAAERHQ